ncbi:MAG: hypothetical protein GX564_02385 [Oligosphaeraceae bacterium]|nr:hypothetical protein [Oligosphaeraceae bacterium]
MNTIPSRAKQAARQWQRKIFLALLCRRALPLTGWAAFLAGGMVLISRFWRPGNAALPPLPVALSCFLPAWGAAALLAWRRVPPARALLVWLDYGNRSGGMLAAGLEVDTSAWNTPEQKDFRLPVLVLSWRRQLPLMLSGLAFLLLAGLLPERHYRQQPQFSLDISRECAALQQKLQVLAEESLLPPAEQEKIAQQLQELQAQNDARAAARTYSMLQALEQSLAARTDAAAAAWLQQAGAQTALAALLDRINALPEDTPRLAAGQEQLAELLQQYSDSIADSGWPAGELSALPAQDWSRLAEHLRQGSRNCQNRLVRMGQPELAQKLQTQTRRMAQNGEPALADWLTQNAPEADALQELCCPGNGDSDYGRADAPLHFSGPAEDGPWQFQDQALPGSGATADSMVLQRRMVPPPPPGPAPAPEEPSAATTMPEGESESRQLRIFPEHRAAVRRYFAPPGGAER